MAIFFSCEYIVLKFIFCIILGKAVRANKKDKKLDLGDFLGRSKDGFQPLNTEEDGDTLSSESDVEDFSVPGLRA